MRQPQADHEERKERHVFGVEERVRVDAGMQEIKRQRKQRQPTAAKHPKSQQVASEATGEKDQMRCQVAKHVNAAAVVQTEQALACQQRNGESAAVIDFVRIGNRRNQGIFVAILKELQERRRIRTHDVNRVAHHAPVVHRGNCGQKRQRTEGQTPHVVRPTFNRCDERCQCWHGIAIICRAPCRGHLPSASAAT